MEESPKQCKYNCDLSKIEVMKRRKFLTAAAITVAAGVGYLLGARSLPSKSQPLTKPKPPATDAKSGGTKDTQKHIKLRWKMITSWPKDAPGTGRTAQRLADRISALTGGRLTAEVYPAGALVGPLEVFDAVRLGTAELGHTASFFWQGKTPSAAYFTTVPFGLSPTAHQAWLEHGGGQELWDRLYANFGLRAFAAGNTGPSMGGWFKRPLDATVQNPLKGLRMRMPGLAGLVVRQLGAIPVTLAPGEVFTSLRGRLIDAAELLGPWHDRAYGLHKAAKYYYYPGFHEPNGSAECLINKNAYASLPQDLQFAVKAACLAENILGLSESEHHNAIALDQLVAEEGVILRKYPDKLLKELRNATGDVLGDLAKSDELADAIYKSYNRAQQIANTWNTMKL